MLALKSDTLLLTLCAAKAIYQLVFCFCILRAQTSSKRDFSISVTIRWEETKPIILYISRIINLIISMRMKHYIEMLMYLFLLVFNFAVSPCWKHGSCYYIYKIKWILYYYKICNNKENDRNSEERRNNHLDILNNE